MNFPKASADATANQNLAFGLLLKRVRQTVPARRPDGLVFGNTGNPLDLKPGYEQPAISAFQDFLDGDTIERYVCQLDTSGNTLRPPASKWGGDASLSWDDLGRKLQAYLSQGKRILVTSDIGIGNGGQDSPVRRLPLLCRRPHSGAHLDWLVQPEPDRDVGP